MGVPEETTAVEQVHPAEHGHPRSSLQVDEKNTITVDPHYATGDERGPGLEHMPFDEGKVFIPDENDEFIDPRLKNYPIPLVAKTVDLHNDPTEPILTFRFWFLSTFWVVVGCGVTTFYYFKPYALVLSSYAIQLLAWGMGDAMAKYLPKTQYKTFGYSWSLNPGPWNAKEHALIIVAYWGSCYTAYGLGPLSAMEMYYGRRINAGWSILFLIASQMIGYGFAGLYRDILVRPPKIYYPGVLPNVALFNAMHKNPAVTKKSLRFFTIVASCAFVYEWIPQLFFPLISSLPLLCYFGHGNPIAYVLGSGNYGMGILCFSLDWNYASALSPMYTPLWANAHNIAGAVFAAWFLYPIFYFKDVLNAKSFPAMSSGTWDDTGSKYNISRVMTPEWTLDKLAMDAYSQPHWGTSYAMYFFWGFAASTGALVYAILFYGMDSVKIFVDAWKGRRNDYDDPYLKLMQDHPRVPHWWYGALLVVCFAISFGTIYGGDFQLPWWGLIVISLVSFVCTFPNGILFGVANTQVGMTFLSELISGYLFAGKPMGVLTCLVYARQILEQNLNLISDYKFGFYMKIPEREMFWGQVWGTLIGPFINYGVMRVVIDQIGIPTLIGDIESTAWLATKTRNYYSISVLWGVLGPKTFFANDSQYHWIYYGFLVGALSVAATWVIHLWKPHWNIEERLNPCLFFGGCYLFPLIPTTNLMTSAILAFTFMGYIYRYHPAWFRKYNYLLGVGLDCGTQLMGIVMVFVVNLPNLSFPTWWGNSAVFDRCYPPASLPPAMQ